MKKDELVKALASKAGSTQAEASKFLNTFIEAVASTLAKKEEINLIGFGKFYITERKAGKGKNPRTGETIDIPACSSPKFKAGKGLKDKANK